MTFDCEVLRTRFSSQYQFPGILFSKIDCEIMGKETEARRNVKKTGELYRTQSPNRHSLLTLQHLKDRRNLRREMEAPTIVEKCGVYLRSQCSSRHVLRDDILFDNFCDFEKRRGGANKHEPVDFLISVLRFCGRRERRPDRHMALGVGFWNSKLESMSGRKKCFLECRGCGCCGGRKSVNQRRLYSRS
jgi:hypothetical protein